MAWDHRAYAALVAVVAMAIVSGGWVFVRLVMPGRPAEWDEAAHGLFGLLIAHDLRTLDALALVYDTYRQIYWPPLHSWLVGTAMLIAGPTLETARLVSVGAYVLLAPTLFLIARILQPRNRNLAGAVAALLALSSPAMIAFGSMAMLELPGLLSISCALLAYCWLERAEGVSPRAHMLVGLFAMVTYFVKSNYGILLMVSIILTKLIQVKLRPQRLATRENLYAILPVVVLSALWFLTPSRLVSTWNALLNQPWGAAEEGTSGPLFYPGAIARLSGSVVMGLLLMASLAMALRRRNGVTLLVVLAVTQLLLGELHHTKAPRHILPLFPSLFVLSGLAAAELVTWLSARRRLVRVAAVVLAAGLALFHARSLAQTRWHTPRHPQLTELMSHISSIVRQHSPSLLLAASSARPGPPIFDFHLATNEPKLSVTGAAWLITPDHQRRLANAVSRAPLPGWLREGARRMLTRYDTVRGTRSLYVGPRFYRNAASFDAELERVLGDESLRAVIAVAAVSDSARYRNTVEPGLRGAGFVETSIEYFRDIGTRVSAYERP